MEEKRKLRDLVMAAWQQNLIGEEEISKINSLEEKFPEEALIEEIKNKGLLPQKIWDVPETNPSADSDTMDALRTSDEKRDEADYVPLTRQQTERLLQEMSGQPVRLSETIRFQHYVIYKKIQEGGMAVIYEAFDKQLHCRVAIKVLKESLESGHRERFQREARILARLHHPHIVRVLTPGRDLIFDTQKPQDFLIMEYVEGLSLNAWLSKQQEITKSPQKWEEIFHAIADIFKKVAEALSYVHEQGILHRDIKPSNIMIAKDGEPKILDFGIAEFSTWLFVPDDFRDASKWIEQLKMGVDPVSVYLKSRLPSDVQSQIAALLPQQTLLDEFLESLVSAMNGLIQTPFYDNAVFQKIPLRTETKKKLRSHLHDYDLIRFNRMLLEDAYPHHFMASYNTMTCDLMGTRNYMSPEQIRKERLTPATDIYSTGVTLYQALCGRMPFVGTDLQVLQQIQNPDLIPDPPRRFIPQIRPDLEAICLKCMEKQTEKRYQNANALSNDLDNFLHNRRTQAKPRTRWTEFQKFAWRYKRSFGVVMLSVWILVIFTFYLWQQENKNFGRALIQRANKYLKESRVFEAKMLAGRAIGFTGFGGTLPNYPSLLSKDSDEWSEAVEILKLYPHVVPIWQSQPMDNNIKKYPTILTGHSDFVQTLAFSYDSKILASGSLDKTIRLWDMSTGKLLQLLGGHSGLLYNVIFSPDGKIVASGSEDKTIRLWDVSTGKLLQLLEGHSDSVDTLMFSPDGKTIASGSFDNTIKLWDVKTGKLIQSLKGHTAWVYSLAFSPDGKILASGSADSSIRIWSMTTCNLIRILEGHSDIVLTVAFSPNGKKLASGSFDKTIKLWDVDTGTQEKSLVGHFHAVFRVSFNLNSEILVSASWDNTIKWWDVSTGRATKSSLVYALGVCSIAWTPDKKILACATTRSNSIMFFDMANSKFFFSSGCYVSVVFGKDEKIFASANEKSIRLWNASTGELNIVLKGHSNNVNSVTFSPNDWILASGSSDKTVKLWNIATGKLIQSLEGHTADVNSVAFSPNGKILASGSSDNTIKLWDVDTCKLIQSLDKHTSDVNSVAFSPNGKILASGSSDSTIKLWDVDTCKLIQSLEGHSHVVFTVVWFHDSKSLASGSADDTIKLWDVGTGKLIKSLEGHSMPVLSLAFKADEKIFASGGSDNSIKLWNMDADKPVLSLHAHPSEMIGLAFSPDGKKMVSSSSDGVIRLWNVSISEKFILESHYGLEPSLAFSPDGKILASGSQEKSAITLWDIKNYKKIKSLEGQNGKVGSIVFNPDGKTMASSTEESIWIWNVDTGKPIKALKFHSGDLGFLAFSPNGKILANAIGRNIMLWDVINYKRILSLEGHSAFVNSVAFSPDGKMLASGSMDTSIKLWDLHTGKEIQSLKGHSGNVQRVVFSANNSILASGSWDRTVKLWDTYTGKEIRSIETHQMVISMSLSPNGEILACGFVDRIKLWNVQTGKEMQSLEDLSYNGVSIAFSPDGKTIAFAGQNIKLWNLECPRYADYLKWVKFDKLDVLWKTPEDK